MIAFITSIRHPANSGDYGRVELLLQRTLASICQQTSNDFVVFVVGNDTPGFPLPPSVTFLKVDFPPPASADGFHARRDDFVWDKGTKIGAGIVAAREVDPEYVMIFDADDFVDRRLAEYANSRPGRSGWVIDRGYMYSMSRNALRKQDAFNRTCGTCHIISAAAYPRTKLTTGASQSDIANSFGPFLDNALGAHRDTAAWFEHRGVVLDPLPFRGAVYHVDTGENHSGKQLTGVAPPLSRALSARFGIPLDSGFAKRCLSAAGPTPILETLEMTSDKAVRLAKRGRDRRR
ncbi:hypothetical protein BDK89_4117 [Ilumatobacter fluminis]|uniref:Glycosyl transferase family 2 n=1 Tax=Ilumatobacter fluminis TaxID=467091 RepID=A0A4R7I6L5_9ACTN|nr:glycosyltransferase family A protein [Ilumatobacter fluminis]TDT18496.1 hypothetical protein BDK89_4117 [Ilumatobacter fluminis]